MTERKQPGEVAAEAIGAITMISREAIKAIQELSDPVVLYVPSSPSGASAPAGDVEISGTEREAFDRMKGNIGGAAGEQVGTTESFADGSSSGTPATSSSLPPQDEETGDDETAEAPPASAPPLSPNERIRAQMGQAAIAAAPTGIASPNDLVRAQQAAQASGEATTEGEPAEPANEEPAPTGEAQ